RGNLAELRVWDIASDTETAHWDCPDGVQSAHFSADGRFFYWIDNTHLPREAGPVVLGTYDFEARRELTPRRFGNTIYPYLVVSDDGKRIATGDLERRVQVHDAASDNVIAERQFPPGETIANLAFLPGSKLVCAL